MINVVTRAFKSDLFQQALLTVAYLIGTELSSWADSTSTKRVKKHAEDDA